MLTQEERQNLAERLQAGVEKASCVTEEEWAAYPADVKELQISTQSGETKVFLIIADKKRDKAPLILNFHGGGFVGKHMDRDELFCRKMANYFSAVVLDVDYKLAPEYPYPAALSECQNIAKWAFLNAEALGADPEKIVFVGNSSGGNLVAGICMYAGLNHLFQPLCAVINYAPLDLKTNPFDKKRSICDMPASRAQMYNEKYITPEKADHPFVSPVFATPEMLEHFPATLVISAGEDSLCEEDELFAMKLAQAGVEVTSKRFTESIHGFIVNRMCEWEQAIKLVFDFIEHQLEKR